MDFKRKKPKGSETRRWVSECKNYCITLRHTYCATVLVEKGDGRWWNFVQGNPPHKSIGKFKRAAQACERHKRLWDAFVKLSHSDGRRDSRLATLRIRAPEVFWYIPLWVRREADPSLILMLCPRPADPSDDTEVSETSSSSNGDGHCEKQSSTTPPSGPASLAAEEAGITTPPTEMSSKATSSRRATTAKPAPAPAEAPRKRSKRSTTKSSPSSEPISLPGKKPKATAKPASASSRIKRK